MGMEELQLLKWIGNDKAYKFELLYRGSRDGFSGQQFHAKCDGKGATITIVKSDNKDHIFGGYTSKSWNSNDAYIRDDDAWLYSLRNINCTPKQFKIVKNPQHAIRTYNGYG